RPWPLDPRGDARTQRRAIYRLGAERYRDLALLLAAEGEMSRSRLAELLDLARSWAPPTFPLTGRDVTALGIPPGERVGRPLAGRTLQRSGLCSRRASLPIGQTISTRLR